MTGGFDSTGGTASIATVTDRVKPVELAGAVAAVHFLGSVAAFVGDEETVTLVTPEGEATQLPLHAGAVLCVASDGRRVVTGGDDGKVVQLSQNGEVSTLVTDPRRRWIDNVALHADGAVAWSAGKTAYVRSGKGEEKSHEVKSTVGGLAFAPKRLRLAISHYNGVTLWFPNMAAAAEGLEWAGSHLGVTFSPDNKFLVTAMHEPALHGWRLEDGKDMRMSGYPAKPRSLSWSAKGRFLATSGANAAVLWPFHHKDGPQGKPPLQLGAREVLVTRVACHPKEELLAIGYQDGMVMAVRFADAEEVLLRRPGGGPVSALAWDDRGGRLAYGTEEGAAGIVTIA